MPLLLFSDSDSFPNPSKSGLIQVVYENNQFKEEKPASEFPETMRFREARIKQDDGTVTMKQVPVARIEVLLIGEDGKLTTSDRATQIVVQNYGADGTPLENTKLMKND